MLELLIVSLGKVPFSSQSQPPPIAACSKALESYLKSSVSQEDPEAIVKQSEIVLNIITRLLKYEWTESRSIVQTSIETVLASLQDVMSGKYQSHRRIIQKVSEKFEELEKPWAISLKSLTAYLHLTMLLKVILFLS
jgi:hypothetical protein